MKEKISKLLPGRLNGTTTIITGGARGMGAAHARRFIDEGVKVVITDTLEEGVTLPEEPGENTGFIKPDICNQSDSKAEETVSLVNKLGNNASIFRSKDKKYFRFEGKEYYAVHKAPGYTGLMIFTGGGVVVPEYQFPELWMFYEHQKDFLKLKK